MKAEFLQLAFKYNAARDCIAGWFYSEKLDGMRVLWDGGVSRGLLKTDIPWANVTKDGRYKSPVFCSGLWTRYGNVIHAPDWWLDNLPKNMMLDGELYISRGTRQQLLAIVKDIIPDEVSWQLVKYHVFDMPSYKTIFKTRHIKNPNFNILIRESHCNAFIPEDFVDQEIRFETLYHRMKRLFNTNEVIRVVDQHVLPSTTQAAESLLELELANIINEKGEGLIVRNPSSYYVTERSKNILKIKPFEDDEAIIVGYISGKETDLGSKLLGKIGALVVCWKDKIFELSGLTDEERLLTNPQWALENPGKLVPSNINGVNLPRNTQITFRYRGLTNDGIPQEARFLRKYVEE